MQFSRKINMLQIFLFTHAKKSVVIHGWLASVIIIAMKIILLALNQWKHEMQTFFLSTKSSKLSNYKVDFKYFYSRASSKKRALCCKCSACQPKKNKKPAKIRLSVAKFFDVDPWKGSQLIL